MNPKNWNKYPQVLPVYNGKNGDSTSSCTEKCKISDFFGLYFRGQLEIWQETGWEWRWMTCSKGPWFWTIAVRKPTELLWHPKCSIFILQNLFRAMSSSLLKFKMRHVEWSVFDARSVFLAKILLFFLMETFIAHDLLKDRLKLKTPVFTFSGYHNGLIRFSFYGKHSSQTCHGVHQSNVVFSKDPSEWNHIVSLVWWGSHPKVQEVLVYS